LLLFIIASKMEAQPEIFHVRFWILKIID